MAQILVKAISHWMEKVNRSNWNQNKLDKYDQRTRKGSPIVVMPDDHIWGKKECLPKFIIIKINDISVNELNRYLQPLIKGHELKDFSKTGIFDDLINLIKYSRRYHIPENVINMIKAHPYNGIIEININQFKSYIIDRNEISIDG